MQEYGSTTVSGNPGAYARMAKYNQGVPGANPPVAAGTVVGQYIVPCWSHIPSYNTLVKPGNCCGYPSISGAYGPDSDTWTPSYAARDCSGVVQCGVRPVPVPVPTQVEPLGPAPPVPVQPVLPLGPPVVGGQDAANMISTYVGGAQRRRR